MPVEMFTWNARSAFRNRVADLRAMESWWESDARDALSIYGRRRVGKSWLLRAFADGKPAVVLVADRLLVSPQMARFETELEPALGVRPAIADVPGLIRACYRAGASERVLVIIDEFPYLLPDGAGREGVLSGIQRVMEEERDRSLTKLVLCGSLIGQMESLLARDSPLHGRLRPLEVQPMDFAEARALLSADLGAIEAIERYAVTGGMARYLSELGSGPLREVVCRAVLDRRAPLFDDPRAVLEQELRQLASYFSLLEELSSREASLDHLTRATGVPGNRLSPYLRTLQEMRLVRERLPVGAAGSGRGRRFRLEDGFIRFWFRFVFPHQDALDGGLDGGDLWDAHIAPALNDHVSATFEMLCLRYARARFGAHAPTIGAWWGDALHAERRSGRRQQEEIDVVGARHRRLRLIGECRWTSRPLDQGVLDELHQLKLPALHQARTLDPDPEIETVLFSRAGFTQGLRDRAAGDPRLHLVDPDELVRGLTH